MDSDIIITNSHDNNTGTAELSVVLAKINELHIKATEISELAKDKAKEAVDYALECGALLSQQKDSLEHGSWSKWCEDNLQFDIRTAQKYMKLSRKFNDLKVLEETSPTKNESGSFLDELRNKGLKEAYVATGILPENKKKTNIMKAKRSDDINADELAKKEKSKHIKNMDSFVKWYRKSTINLPITGWTSHNRQSLMLELRPLVDIFKDLKEVEPDFLK